MSNETLASTAERPSTILVYTFAAVAVMFAIATENWVALLIAGAVPLVILAPVQASLGIFAFLVPFDSVFIVSESGTTLNWFIGASAAAVLLFTALVQGRLQAPPRAALLWCSLVIWCLASTAWAMDADTALQRVPTAVSLLLVYLVAVSFRITLRELQWVAGMALLGGVAAAACLIFQGFSTAATSRLSLGTAGPNLYAATMLLPSALALSGILLLRSRTLQIALALVICVITSSVFLSMSRGGLIALATVVLVFIIRYRNWRLLFLVALLFIPLWVMPTLFFHRMEQGLYNRGTGRFDIWVVGWAILRDHGLLGVGLDNFRVAYTRYSGVAPIFRGYSKVAHNVPLQVVAEMGVVGLALFVAACREQLRSVFSAMRRVGALAKPTLVAYEAACWGVLVMGLSLDIMWRKAFWLVWILSALAVRVHGQNSAAQSQSEVAGAVRNAVPYVPGFSRSYRTRR